MRKHWHIYYTISAAQLAKTNLICTNTTSLRYLDNIQNAKITTTTTHVEQGRATSNPTTIIRMCGFFRLSEQGNFSLISFGPKIYLRRFHARGKVEWNLFDPCGAVLKISLSAYTGSLVRPNTISLRYLKYPKIAIRSPHVEQSDFQNIRARLHVCV